MASATFRIWRGEKEAGKFVDYTTEIVEGMVVLDAVHRIQATQAGDLAVRWNCKAGKCGSCSAEVNGMPKLLCMTRLSDLSLDEPVRIGPMRAFPPLKDLVTDVSWNYEVKKKIKPFKPRPPDAADGTWRMDQKDVDRVQEFRKCIECYLCQNVCHVLRDHQNARQVHRATLPGVRGGARDAPARYRESHRRPAAGARCRYCNITKCCTKVCPEHITITDNAIIPLKERVVDELYDPVQRLFRMFRRGD
jgi:succinate dehydrogenase / fumarate reductase iron-sulfur subunit